MRCASGRAASEIHRTGGTSSTARDRGRSWRVLARTHARRPICQSSPGERSFVATTHQVRVNVAVPDHRRRLQNRNAIRARGDFLAVSGVALILSSLLERRSGIAFHAKEIPVAADVFQEFRSPGLRAAMERMAQPRDTPPEAGFQGLSEDERDEACTLCYFFEYLGVRSRFSTGSLFLPYFEHLVARLEQRRRHDGTICRAGVKLRRVRRMVHQVVHPAAGPDRGPTTQTVHGSE
jgi:hypothetical protein